MPADRNTGEVPRVRPFGDFLRDQGKGSTHEELGDNLHELIQRVQDTGKKGTLTLILTVAPVPDTGMVITTDEIRLKLPEYHRPGSHFYVDAEGNLTRNDPQQGELFESIREVPPLPAPVDPYASKENQA